ncbi:DUF5071 domain-containing protein [Rhizobacter sp. SG703]|uniref:DUF5071 domain-containing protein n=1 Tax=Rhizobacter sp. SG703 TaxID=2587140 RepID=UPI001445087D|nr:DUF5071 domain-containing protein [Rhizobacter sp. SG703]NKI93725.1 hypothetical protein [Rhizobacter sp. SG703]
MISDLRQLIPSDKHDVRSAEALATLGYPTIEPVLPQLLEWVQDGNWPVAQALSPLLASVGADLAPHARTVLNGADDTWKYFLIQAVVTKSPALALVLMPELKRLASHATPGETAEGIDKMADELIMSMVGRSNS